MKCAVYSGMPSSDTKLISQMSFQRSFNTLLGFMTPKIEVKKSSTEGLVLISPFNGIGGARPALEILGMAEQCASKSRRMQLASALSRECGRMCTPVMMLGQEGSMTSRNC